MRTFIRMLVLIFALLVPNCAFAAANDDGMLRVRLASLGRPQKLTVTVRGEYRLGDLRFCRGAELVFQNHGGNVWLIAGDVMMNLGPDASLERGHSDSEINGLTVNESNLYCGDLTLSARDGGLVSTLSISAEAYLLGVVPYEMSDSFPIEALKAQSVAARTYAMARKAASAGRDYDLKDTTADQVFRGFDPRHVNAAAAVRATEGVVGMVNGEFAACYYTASNGGEVSVPGDVWSGEDQGHIARRADPYDLENPLSLVNDYAFQEDLSGCNSLKEMLVRAANEETGRRCAIERVLSVEPVNPVPENSSRFTALRFELLLTGGETAVVDLDVFDRIKPALSLGLNGGDYERVSVVRTDGGFRIEMRGFGHGVGMSQRGAQQMAGSHGKTWREILGFYYPGMTLETIAFDPALPETFETLPVKELPEPEKGEQIAVVNVVSALNMRETPSADARILTTLAGGERVLAKILPGEDGWVKIRTADNAGYAKREYITIE